MEIHRHELSLANKAHAQPAAYLLLAMLTCGWYSPAMSSATLQQIGQDLPSWVALVQHGESVAILNEGHEVAWLVPPKTAVNKSAPASKAGWPDFAARRRALFGNALLPAGTAQALVDEDRGI